MGRTRRNYLYNHTTLRIARDYLHYVQGGEALTLIRVSDWLSAAAYTFAFGGGTFDREGNHAAIRNGYVVGGSVPTRSLPVPPMPQESQANWLAGQLAMFAAQHASQLSTRNHGYIGTWYPDKRGNVQLDLSEWVEDATQAMALAVYRGEEYVYDVAAGRDISVTRGRVALEIAMEDTTNG